MDTNDFQGQVLAQKRELEFHAYRLLKDNDAVQDLIQDTMLKAFANQDKFRAGTKIGAWLYTIMKNTFITHYYRPGTKYHLVDIDEIPSNYRMISYNMGMDALSTGEIEKAINQLPQKFKTPFTMYNQGFKYEEIAEILNLPLGTIKNRIHTARRRVQELLHSMN